MPSDINFDAIDEIADDVKEGAYAGNRHWATTTTLVAAERADYRTGALSRSGRLDDVEGKEGHIEIRFGTGRNGEPWVDGYNTSVIANNLGGGGTSYGNYAGGDEHVVDYADLRHEQQYDNRTGEPHYLSSSVNERANEHTPEVARKAEERLDNWEAKLK